MQRRSRVLGRVSSVSAVAGAAIFLALAVRAAPPEASPVKTELVQTLHTGKDIHVRALNAFAADLAGGFLYVCGEDGISGFTRDLQTGKLTFVENQAEPKCGGYAIRFAGGRLYAVTPHSGTRRMNWHGLASFEIDGATGKLTRKDVVACPPSRQMVVGPDGKDLYLKTIAGSQPDRVLWYHLGADGKPTRAGEAMGKGIGSAGHEESPNLLVAAPDGKNLYCISTEDHAIVCIARKPTGEINFAAAVDLAAFAPRDPNGYRYQWASLAISPDGKWLYAALWNGKRDENRVGIFRRDPATGELTLKETLAGDQNPLANLRAWNLVFSPDGSAAFLGSWAGPVMAVKCDPQTGQLVAPAAVAESKGFSSALLVFDAANGFLYGGGTLDDFCNFDGLFVVKTEKAAPPK